MPDRKTLPIPNTLLRQQIPHVVFQPQTYQGMQRGVNKLVNAIKPTLGPLPRYVAIEQIERRSPPEILDKGALIARRITHFAHPDEELGAMLVRQMLWQQYELCGDGTATAAILFQSIFNEGIKYITAGGNAMRLRTYLIEGLQSILPCLAQQKVGIKGHKQINQVALTLCQDRLTADILGEVFDTLGEYGRVDIRSGQSRQLEREYVHGIYWESGVHGQELILDKLTNRADLEQCAVFVSDLEFDDPRTLLPIISAAAHSGALVIIASKLSERAIGLLTHINRTPQRFQVIAVKIPDNQVFRTHMLEDIARITGAHIFLQATQEGIQNVQTKDLGHVERVWANKDYFCIVEDGDAGQNRVTLLSELHQRLQNKTLSDEQRTLLRERIGQLQGASAVLLVGGVQLSDIDNHKAKLREMVSALRSCLVEGIISGGGVALLNCQSALEVKCDSQDIDERAAYRILSHALGMPLRQILQNAGIEPGTVVGDIQNEKIGSGFDITTRQICSMIDAGIVDSAEVITKALDRAVRTGALALTIDVLVHHRNPTYAANP